jgi:MinD-like ATPase involved in chromosome partitioning or flagellar assembly
MTGQYYDHHQHNAPQTPPPSGDDGFSEADRHHLAEDSATIRIPDLVKPRKAPPTMGWRKVVYYGTFTWVNLGKSRPERHMDELVDRIKRPIRHRYVIAVMSGGSAGKTTVAAALGETFRIHRTAPVLAIDAAPGFGPLAGRIAANLPGDVPALLNETEIQGYSDVRQYLGANKETGLEVLAGDRSSAPNRTIDSGMFDAVMGMLTRTGHEIVLVDCGDDPEHPVMKAVLNYTNMLVLVSGLTPDSAVPVTRTIEWLKAAGYHQLVSRAMVILNDYRGGASKEARRVLRERFEKVAAVEELPFDPFLAKGAIIDVRHELGKATRLRLHEIAARLADFYIPDADRQQTRWGR